MYVFYTKILYICKQIPFFFFFLIRFVHVCTELFVLNDLASFFKV